MFGLLSAGVATADVEVPGLFSDHMVLQQGQAIPVWGSADPGEGVTVEFAGQKKSVAAGPDGAWMIRIGPLSASVEPRPLVIRGTNTITINDVLVGEVWLCAGQSNMAMAFMEADNAKEEMSKSDPLLRAFRVPERCGERPWSTVNGDWTDFHSKTASRWSAMPYFFGRRLREALNVPVGLVVCAWGGSSAVTWMSREALRDPGNLAPEDVIGWRSNIQPSKLYNGMLHPLAPYAVAGVAWYQGETEGEPPMNPYVYRFLFPAMIEDWRRLWDRPDLPFYWVQLPNLRNKPAWAIVRESQSEALKLPHTGMVPTIDIGRERALHPGNKREFGARLGNLVLAKSYQRDTWPGAPEYEKMQIAGDAIRLTLRDASGLKTIDSLPPKSFLIAADDGNFQPAAAEIEGETVIVSAPAVRRPTAVRYAWDGNPPVNLVNAAGLPLIPFRTDSWPLEGQQRHWEPLTRKSPLVVSADGGQLAKGGNPAWTMVLRGISSGDMEKFNILRKETAFCQIAFSGERRGTMTLESPALYWTTKAETGNLLDAAKGVTAEIVIQMYRATDPFRGFDLEVGLRRPGGKFRRYLVSVVPMRVFAFQKKEIHLLASDLDNMAKPHAYRLAIRPDGVAQVYFDGNPIGLFEGEAVDGDAPSEPYILAGKQIEAGEFTVNFYTVAVDPGGAFAGETR